MQNATRRELQRMALEELAEAFPERRDVQNLFPDETRESIAAVLAYLEQHDLISVRWSQEIGAPATPVMAAINAKGIDFLADDGGLGAILGVVTVKIHDETLRVLLEQAVDQSSAEPGQKARLIEQVRALPAEGLKEATLAAARAGLAATPAALVALRGYLGV